MSELRKKYMEPNNAYLFAKYIENKELLDYGVLEVLKDNNNNVVHAYILLEDEFDNIIDAKGMRNKKEMMSELPDIISFEENPNDFNISDITPQMEKEILALYNSFNFEVASLIDEFMHGKCHEFAFYASNFLDGKPIECIIDYDEESEMEVLTHAYVLLDDDLILDAKGIRSKEEMMYDFDELYEFEEISFSKEELLKFIYKTPEEINKYKEISREDCIKIEKITSNIDLSPMNKFKLI